MHLMTIVFFNNMFICAMHLLHKYKYYVHKKTHSLCNNNTCSNGYSQEVFLHELRKMRKITFKKQLLKRIVQSEKES